MKNSESKDLDQKSLSHLSDRELASRIEAAENRTGGDVSKKTDEELYLSVELLRRRTQHLDVEVEEAVLSKWLGPVTLIELLAFCAWHAQAGEASVLSGVHLFWKIVLLLITATIAAHFTISAFMFVIDFLKRMSK